MVVRYVRRKLTCTIIFIAGTIAVLLGTLQISYIQKCILNIFVSADFEKISGVFPFNFSIYKLNLKVDNTNVDIDKISVKLGKKCNKIKNVTIETVDISSPKSELKSLNIKKYIPLLAQRVVRNISVENIIYNGNKIGKLNLSVFTNLHSSNILFETSDSKKLMITTEIINSAIYIGGNFEEVAIQLCYDTQTDGVSTTITKQNKELITLRGTLKPNSLNGIATIPNSCENIAFNATIENNSIYFDGYCQYANGIETKAVYDLETSRIHINELVFGKKIFFKPFIVNSDYKIQNLEMFLPKGKVSVTDIDLNSDSFNLGKAKFENIDIASLQDGEQEKISGTLNGSGYFQDETEHFNFTLNNLEYGILKIPSVKIEGKYRKDKLGLKILYNILEKINSINITAKPDQWIINRETKIDVTAKGFFILENCLKKIKKQIIQGKLSYDLHIDGAISNPHYAGSLSLKNGIYINKTSNTFLKNGSIDLAIKEKDIIINNISATDDLKNEGKLTGSGKIFYKNGEPFVDIKIDLFSLEAIATREFTGKLFGKININGNMTKEIKIKGVLHSNNASFDISNFVNMASYDLEILDSIKKKPTTSPSGKQPSQIKIPLDINFKFVPKLYIVGFGIDSVWNGGFEIKGDASDPHYKFEIILEKGILNVAGKNFKLKNGKVLCSNKTKGAINVDVSAVKSIEKRKVGARFLQDSKSSDVIFFSKPHASKNDVLSYMLFEKPASEISTGEALTLITIMGKVSGKGSLDVVDKLKAIFGLDSLEIKRHNNEDTGNAYNALSIGKKVGKLKISIDKGSDKDTTSVVVEAEIAKNTKLSVDMGDKNNVGGGILWGKRY